MPKLINPRVPAVGPLSGIQDDATRQALQPLVDAHNARNSPSSAEGFVTRKELRDGFDDSVARSISATLANAASRGSGSGSGFGALFEAFARSIFDSSVWKALTKKIDWLDSSTNATVMRMDTLATGITRTEHLTESMANTVEALKVKQGESQAVVYTEKTTRIDSETAISEAINVIFAAVGKNEAMIYESGVATANYDAADASKFVQLQAEVFGGPGEDPIRVALVEEATARASLEDGINATWTVRMEADGRFAGFGLGLEGMPGAVQSTFIVTADKFAIVQPGAGAGDSHIPFGVDASGIFMNGLVRIDATGPALADLADITVVSQYAKNTSPTVAPVSGWSSAAPSIGFGEYMWVRTGSVIPPETEPAVWNDPYRASGRDGTNGTNGSAGARGSLTLYISGSSWSDAAATAAITAAAGAAGNQIGDTVTISNGTNFVQTRYWSGAAWVSPGVVIDGNLLVNGTISTTKLVAGDLTAFGITTAASGTRWEMKRASAGFTYIAGFFGAEVSPRVLLDASNGTFEYNTRNTSDFCEINGAPASGISLLDISATGAGNGLRVQAPGSGYGALLTGNATRAALRLDPTGTLPTDRSAGSVCYYSGWLCFANGAHWYRSDGTQLT